MKNVTLVAINIGFFLQTTKLKTDNGVFMRDDPSSVQSGSDGLSFSSVTQRTSSPLIGQCQGDMLVQAEEAPPPIISRRISTSQTLDKPLGLDQAILYSIDCCGEKWFLVFWLAILFSGEYFLIFQ